MALEPPEAPRRPRLTPPMADARRAITDCLEAEDAARPGGIAPGSLFLIAVSGGADSLALAYAASFVFARAGHRVEAIIIDHQLQHDSAEVALTAQETLKTMGVDAHIVPVDIGPMDIRSGDSESGDVMSREVAGNAGNIESRARDARYEALSAVAASRGATAVLLGHTKDDQAETVLLGLTRGSGPQSIAGMQSVSGLWWRPFLGLSRAATEQVCVDAGLAWWSDPHNSEDRFVRPRIRHRVMPVLEQQLGPGVADALVRTAELVRQDGEVLDQMANDVYESLGDQASAGIVPVGLWQSQPAAVVSRVLRLVAKNAVGSHLSHTHTEALMRLVTHWRGQGPVDIPGGRVVRQGDELRFSPQ
ncbi:tRNA(Ile)-lysidine synthase [Pontimonas salivibrio]|uniref:tRNA(Ile)-lysidine synthase n=1 Tax=Pontimonas salivibrio TaxID=1159327 RepID=A0A2L2BN50_9MICO|nr:tRNA lysidine(34) synthetase TilS [Pontimonas salivibrio]AVG23058.1 tRNA(Ile)-lysidine synthase [Pontimonas salivibrio]